MRANTWLKIAAAIVALTIIAFLSFSSPFQRAALDDVSEYVTDRGFIFVNTSKDVKYVGTEACRPCHEEICDAYLHSPTGRSMSKMGPDNVIESFPQKEVVYDSSRNFFYEMVEEGGRYFQREFRLDQSGNLIHERKMEAQYIIGSGSNLRIYFNDENGMLYQLPLTWYVHEQRWDMSPGYREFVNVRFSRYATTMCISCHNGHMQLSQVADDRYEKPLKLGIDCEDCHGPGDLHVREFEGEDLGLPENALTIVNSPRLSVQRQVDICQACHLEGVARTLVDGQGWFDFRPGMLLSEHRAVYSPSNPDKHAFRVANTAYRLSNSRCFQGSHAAMTCTMCHDSHGMLETSKIEYNRQNCQKCHPPESLPGKTSAFPHSPSDDCIPCHMKPTGTKNTLHGVVNHDHWIRVDAEKDSIDWSDLRHFAPSRQPFRLVADIDAEDGRQDLRLGMAYADMYWGEHETRRAYLDSALVYLTKVLEDDPDDADANTYLGRIRFEFGKYSAARAALTRAAKSRPAHADTYFWLGRALEMEKKPEEAASYYNLALERKSGEPRYLEKLGLLLAGSGKTDEAIAILEKSVAIDKQNPVVFYTLGNLYVFERKDPETALRHFQRTVMLDPDFRDGRINLGNTYAMLDRFDDAADVYRQEIANHPKSINALLNLGRVLEKQGKTREAMGAYQRALTIDPLTKQARIALRSLAEK